MKTLLGRQLGWVLAILLAGALGVQTAGSQVPQPKVWKEGDTLTAADLNASLAAVQAGAGKPALPYAWSAFAPASQERGDASPDGHVAQFTFTSPEDGFAYVSAQFEVRVRNTFDALSPKSCRVESLLGQTKGFPGCMQSEFCNIEGYGQTSINGNLPTQLGGGTFLGINQSLARIVPVVRGVNTIYLNGRSDCSRAVYGTLTVSAVLVQKGMPATLTIP